MFRRFFHRCHLVVNPPVTHLPVTHLYFSPPSPPHHPSVPCPPCPPCSRPAPQRAWRTSSPSTRSTTSTTASPCGALCRHHILFTAAIMLLATVLLQSHTIVSHVWSSFPVPLSRPSRSAPPRHGAGGGTRRARPSSPTSSPRATPSGAAFVRPLSPAFACVRLRLSLYSCRLLQLPAARVCFFVPTSLLFLQQCSSREHTTPSCCCCSALLQSGRPQHSSSLITHLPSPFPTRALFEQRDRLGALAQAPISALGLGLVTETDGAVIWRPVVTAPADMSVLEVVRHMQRTGVSAVGIVDEAGRLVANFSASDLRSVSADNLGAD